MVCSTWILSSLYLIKSPCFKSFFLINNDTSQILVILPIDKIVAITNITEMHLNIFGTKNNLVWANTCKEQAFRVAFYASFELLTANCHPEEGTILDLDKFRNQFLFLSSHSYL